MLTVTSIDILKSDAQVIVVPVNCKGSPGAGLARAAANKYPHWVEPYKAMCECGLQPGDVFFDINGSPRVWTAATKDHWYYPSRYEWVDMCLKNIAAGLFQFPDIQSIAVPALGCGLGKLEWPKVRVMAVKRLARVAANVILVPPA